MYHPNFHTKMIIFNIFNKLKHPNDTVGIAYTPSGFSLSEHISHKISPYLGRDLIVDQKDNYNSHDPRHDC